MIFYATTLSSYSAKVRIALQYKGLSYKEIAPPGGYRSESYLQLVPMGSVPALMVNGQVFSESEVILEYLEERFPAPNMLPPDLMDRARTRFYARFHDLYFEPLVRNLFSQVNPSKRNPAVVSKTRLALMNRFEQMNSWPTELFQFNRPIISLADCGFLVNIPLASALLQACGEDDHVPERWLHWWQSGHQIPPVVTALASWKLATKEWVSSQTS